MRDRLRLVEINYHHHTEFSTPQEVIARHRPSNLVLEAMREKVHITLVKHAAFEGVHKEGDLEYRFFKGKNALFHIPFSTNSFVSSLNPDIVLVQGFIFPVQVMHLRKKLGKHSRILLQHQGDRPGGKRQVLQRWTDSAVDAYLFRSKGNAGEWEQRKIIRDPAKVREIADASTWFHRLDKRNSRLATGIKGSPAFIWVGRLDSNKDPFTVLNAFGEYVKENPRARLYMHFSGGDLKDEVYSYVAGRHILNDNVELVGMTEHADLQSWFSAADYFISASHHEGGSYALVEAMACGCIPIVSAIAPALQMTGNGDAGFSFRTGDHLDLLRVLRKLETEGNSQLSNRVEKYFRENLSADAIALQWYALLNELRAK